MEIRYRKSFLRDLKKLKNNPAYEDLFEFSFFTMAKIEHLREMQNIRPMKGYPNRFRIRLGSFRIGIEVGKEGIEMVRVLNRREFYRYFP